MEEGHGLGFDWLDVKVFTSSMLDENPVCEGKRRQCQSQSHKSNSSPLSSQRQPPCLSGQALLQHSVAQQGGGDVQQRVTVSALTDCWLEFPCSLNLEAQR